MLKAGEEVESRAHVRSRHSTEHPLVTILRTHREQHLDDGEVSQMEGLGDD